MRTCVVRWPHHAVTFRRSGGLHAGARWCMEPRLGRGVPCAKPRQAMRRCNEAQRVSERARLPGCVAQRVYLYAWPHAHALYLHAPHASVLHCVALASSSCGACTACSVAHSVIGACAAPCGRCGAMPQDGGALAASLPRPGAVRVPAHGRVLRSPDSGVLLRRRRNISGWLRALSPWASRRCKSDRAVEHRRMCVRIQRMRSSPRAARHVMVHAAVQGCPN